MENDQNENDNFFKINNIKFNSKNNDFKLNLYIFCDFFLFY